MSEHRWLYPYEAVLIDPSDFGAYEMHELLDALRQRLTDLHEKGYRVISSSDHLILLERKVDVI